MRRGAAVEIDLGALSQNIALIRRRVADRPIIAVVKADAYGHGAPRVSRKLIDCGVGTLGVAFISEAVELRESGIRVPIVVFFDHEVTEDLLKYRLVPVVSDLKTARRLSSLAERSGKRIAVHLNIDTGMGRLGFDPGGVKEVAEAFSLRGLQIAGLMSHFSDADLADLDFARVQLGRFKALRDALAEKGMRPACHIANSAAIMTLPDSLLDAVRPGLIIYGCNPYSSLGTRPVMRVKTKLLSVRRLKKATPVSYGRTFVTRRDSIVGVLPMGYADGLLRGASNNAEVLVRGRRVPVVGRICMDLTMVDLTDVKGVRPSEEVTIVGSQGGESITVEELASKAGTIPYEVMTSLGGRNRRVYLE